MALKDYQIAYAQEDYATAITLLVPAAETGDADAQFLLANLYRAGKGVDKDLACAVYWYRQAAQQKMTQAERSMALLYQEGHGVPQDMFQAADWYAKAAASWDVEAQCILGAMYAEGRYFTRSKYYAMKWYTYAAMQGNVQAQCALAHFYGDDAQVDQQDFPLAYLLLYLAQIAGVDNAAEALQKLVGSMSEAQLDQGQAMYLKVVNGELLSHILFDYQRFKNREDIDAFYEGDYSRAFPLCYDSAHAGDMEATYCLSEMYRCGWGTEQDAKKSMYWTHIAAENGHAGTQFILAQRYLYGIDVPGDIPTGMMWLQRASEGDSPGAQYLLMGICLEAENKAEDAMQANQLTSQIPESPVDMKPIPDPLGTLRCDAMYWLVRSAENGYAKAQYMLGQAYRSGVKEVEQDVGKAAEWFRKAALAELPDAQYMIGVLYDEGMGVPKDDVEALRWHKMAAENGQADAQYLLSALYHLGTVAPNDREQSAYWLRKAAEQGHVSAQFNMGVLCESGYGQGERENAAYWFKLSAMQAHPESICNLGVAVYEGDGAEKNIFVASVLMHVAGAFGIDMAINNLGLMRDHFDWKQATHAQELAKKLQNPEALADFIEAHVHLKKRSKITKLLRRLFLRK